MMRRMVKGLVGLCLALGAQAVSAQKPPLVLAAASLQESLTAAADAWAAKGHPKPTLSFAASSALARQIDAGAPADLFVSADEPWMDDVQKNGKVKPGTRSTFLANTLVLVAPATAHGGTVAIRPNFPLATLLGDGRLAMADPDAVPAGKYGKAALTQLGVWPQVQAKVAPGDSVRAALAYVERGQTPYGIVYGTDARASKAVKVVGTFPEKSHAPITYPIATLTTATSPDADGFRAFLISGAGKAIFRRYGFIAR